MDPIYHYLTRIPIVLSVQGCIDDNTIAGPSGDLTLCMHVQYCYRKIGGMMVETEYRITAVGWEALGSLNVRSVSGKDNEMGGGAEWKAAGVDLPWTPCVNAG